MIPHLQRNNTPDRLALTNMSLCALMCTAALVLCCVKNNKHMLKVLWWRLPFELNRLHFTENFLLSLVFVKGMVCNKMKIQ